MYLKYNENYWAVDIEGDLIPSTKVYVVCAVNIHDGRELVMTEPDQIRRWFQNVKISGGKFVGHNFIGYDAPTLNRIIGTRIAISDIIDTMLTGMAYNPSLEGGHSLEEWGKRLNFPKGDFNDFDKFSEEMVQYCLQDCRLTRKVYLTLLGRMTKVGFTEEGLDIEHRAWQLVKKQQQDGFEFNEVGAFNLLAFLRQRENEIADEVHKFWPPKIVELGTYKRPFKKDGSPSAVFLKHKEEYDRVEISNDRLSYKVFGPVSFNIGSAPQRIEKFLEAGWKPREFTDTGQPKATHKGKLSPSLEAFVEDSGRQEIKLVAQWIEVNARGNMINTWIEALGEDKRIHGSLWLANTLRYRHSNPNTANIPAVRVGEDDKPLLGESGVWTYEARDLWVHRPGDRRLVGVDAKGIQLRVLAHYLNNKEFTDAVLGGDPHSYNQRVGGFATRAVAKTFIYAFLLGAGDAKVGQIIGGSTKDGKEVKARFVSNFPGLSNLLSGLQRQVDRTGRIRLCDGTPLLVVAPHTRLGYLLQGDESRIMKKAAITMAKENYRRGLDVIKVGDIHDEWQLDTATEAVPELTEDVLPFCFRTAGESFSYRLPIDCDSKVGGSWAETH